MTEKTITRADYFKLLGILTLAGHYDTLLQGLEEAALEITSEDERWGHTSDAVYDEGHRDVDALLKRLKITVREEES